jgi:hypothetical protein
MRFLILFSLSQLFLGAQEMIFREALSPRNANYRIDVTLNPEYKMLIAKQTLTWRNISNIGTNELHFHMYLNAFSSPKTTFNAISGGKHRGQRMSKKDNGWIRISTMTMDKQDITDKIQFIQPDDGNVHDSTVFKITLDELAKPGDEIQIEFEFESKLPKVYARTGFYEDEFIKDFFIVSQWFPKIAVLENQGWNAHQFHSNTEFYADFGVYDVNITVPREFKVGATGIMSELKDNGETISYRYHAEDVHDFAWTAYPDFETYSTSHGNVAIKMMYNKEQSSDDVMEQVNSLKYGLDYFQGHFGPYPYPNITLVNAPEGAGAANGMEYPTFITGGFNPAIPRGMRFRSEMVTIHEFGHQIFHHILSSNEFEHSWMDEGLTTYGTSSTIDDRYGAIIDLAGFKVKSFDFDRFVFLTAPNHESVMNISFKQNPSNYGVNSYMRPSVLLKSLEGYLGKPLFDDGMKHYYQKWKYKHPYPKDFFDAMEEGTKKDLRWFFNQYFYDNKTVDYQVSKITSKGYRKSDQDLSKSIPKLTSLDNDSIFYRNIFVIENLKEGWYPVEVKITLFNGTVLRQNELNWDYKSKYQLIEFYANSNIKKVEIDPERKNWMDLNFTNNGLEIGVDNAASKFTNRWMFWFQNIIQIISGF